ncbi:MAG TPA: phosphatase PAP2 family protein [Planctomycetaceae bacterium]|nr:phosphatase PAP2 family protein [Planctomycetaceae bacterium]
MTRRRLTLPFLAATVCSLFFNGPHESVFAYAPVAPANNNDPVLKWNAIALQAVVDDHSGTYGSAEQGGPTRTSRALAIVHLAIYDAVNAIVGGHEPYIEVLLPDKVLSAASIEVAVAQAAHDTLSDLYPNQADRFAWERKAALKKVAKKRGRDEGVQVGRAAAINILLARVGDGGDAPNLPSDHNGEHEIGVHSPDPYNPKQGLLTPAWGAVVPFAMDDVTNFQAPAPPMPNSDDILERMAYALAYEEAKALGGDGEHTPTERTPEQTEIGLFWAYDGAIGLGVPPRLYNQITRVIAKNEKNSIAENARLFALVNMSLADAGIASWYCKYAYKYWRPVVAIRCGNEDGNEFTTGDEDWKPFCAPASNQSNGGVDFTPPFPAYTSGHATFGAAMFRTLADFYGTDDYSFLLISDEMHGKTTDSQGVNRHTVVREFHSFSEASRENAESRIYLGIHWKFDAVEGIELGNAVADYTFDNYLRPLP